MSRTYHVTATLSMKVCIVAIIITALVGCATDSPHRKAAGGMTAGAAVGALIGAIVGGEDGAAIGALIGAGVGVAVGAQLDADDHRKRQAALAIAATQPSGDYAHWSSPEKETRGQVARVGELFTVNGQRCMQVEEWINIKGEPHMVKDMRCENGSGLWEPKAT